MILEVCVDSVESAVNAELGGADRIELCGDLVVGGVTPSLALYERIREKTDLPIHVLLRPRFGDFLYSEEEMEVLIRQAKMFAEADRVINGETIIRRTIQFGFKHYPDLDREGHIARAIAHLHEKYGRGGYLRLWIPWSENAVRLNALQDLIADPDAILSEVERIYDSLV